MPKENRKVTIIGWYGHQNLGDELMLEGLRQLFKDWHITVMSNTPSADAKYPMFNADIANESDLILLGGGELIQRDRLFLEPKWTDSIKETVPKFILGCGINAQKYSQLSASMLRELEKFCFIGLRDRYSLNILNNSPAHNYTNRLNLFYDPAFSIDIGQVKPIDTGKRLVIIAPTDRINNKYDFGVTQTNFANKFAKQFREKLSFFDRVVFVAFGNEDNNDYLTCQKIASVIPNDYEIIKGTDTCKVLQYFAGADRVYTARLHGLLLAKLFGKSCSIFSYHWKLDRAVDTLLGCNVGAIRVWQRQCLDEALHLYLCSTT